jgi:dUTP pyrophosphatase
MTASSRKSPKHALKLRIARLPHGDGLPLPAYQTPDAAGMDLIAALAEGDELSLLPGTTAKVPTGLILELPRGTEGQVRPRSGLAAKHGVTVLNAPGTIDADYRGEVAVLLINHGDVPFTIRRGDRIAQLVVAPVLQIAISAKTRLSSTQRGSGGFGSTGIEASKSPTRPANKSKSVRRKTSSQKTSSQKNAKR